MTSPTSVTVGRPAAAQRRPTVFIGNDERGVGARGRSEGAQRRPTVFIGNARDIVGEGKVVSVNAQRRPTVFIGNDRASDRRHDFGVTPLNEGRRCSSAMTPCHSWVPLSSHPAQRRPTVFIGNDRESMMRVDIAGCAQRRPTVFIGNDPRHIGRCSALDATAQRRPTVFIGNDPPNRHSPVSTSATLNEGRRCSSAMTPLTPTHAARRSGRSTKADGVHRQ